MIPTNITREHILQAIYEIKNTGVPKGNESRRYVLEYDNSQYPPKYVIALANKFANGGVLASCLFNGGYETNNFLTGRGFSITLKNGGSSKADHSIKGTNKRQAEPSTAEHLERCPACKVNIYKLLRRLYGNVEQNKSLGLGSRLEDYRESPDFPVLERIYHALQEYREHTNFVNKDKLPACDFFVSYPATIIEYDERQHFTRAREITLSLYPKDIEIQYDIDKWKSLCRSIAAKDNDPAYRDEQRAWYDTLRDFAPTLLKIHPTIRIVDNERKWCALQDNNDDDIREFERMLRGGYSAPIIETRIEQNPELARLVISGPWNSDIEQARRILERICEIWPKDVRVKYFLTCGGFVGFPMPDHLQRKARRLPSVGSEALIGEIKDIAMREIDKIMSGGLRACLAEHADFMTIGIDSKKSEISTTQNLIKDVHAELVYLVGLKDNARYFTGKSYPTNNQQRTLLRITDLPSHFPNIPGNEQVMILGCHDLAIFSPRSDNSQGERRILRDCFREMAKNKRPAIVLQHPHTADSVRTWGAMWGKLREMLPSVRLYAGAGRYYRKEGQQRSQMDEVLQKTKMGPSIDFIVKYD